LEKSPREMSDLSVEPPLDAPGRSFFLVIAIIYKLEEKKINISSLLLGSKNKKKYLEVSNVIKQ